MRKTLYLANPYGFSTQQKTGPLAALVAALTKWRSRYAGASVADVKRLRELAGEHAKLKRMYADLALEHDALKDVLARKL